MTVDMADKVFLRRVWRQPNQSINTPNIVH
jgi:hypothetical protein